MPSSCTSHSPSSSLSLLSSLESSIDSSLLSLSDCRSVGELSDRSNGVKRLIRALQEEIDNLEMSGNTDNSSDVPLDTLFFHREYADAASKALREFLLAMKVELSDPARIRRRFFANSSHNTAAAPHAHRSAADLKQSFSHSLQATRSHLLSSLDRSQSSLTRLKSSTEELAGTGNELNKYSSTLKVGEKVISRQIQRERTEKRLILIATIFFFLVVLYIVNKRLRILSGMEMIIKWIK